MAGPSAALAPLSADKSAIHVVHVFSTFGPGGQQARTCTLLNAFGPRFHHTLISTDGQYASADRLDPSVSFNIAQPPPGKGGLAYPVAFAKALRGFSPDLLLTYNWGAFDAVMGAVLYGVCPVIHIEDGFGVDEANGLKTRRVLTRRLFINRTAGILVPSETLKTIATRQYRAKPSRIFYIPNGVDTDRFQPGTDHEWRHMYNIPAAAVVVGFVGRLSAEKNVAMLVRAVKSVSAAHLVLVGDGREREELQALAARLGIKERVTFIGEIADTSRAYRAFDVFGLPSLTEQMPMSLLEAMATGLPAVCTDVGDCRAMLGGAVDPEILPIDTEIMARALGAFTANRELRASVGIRNRSIAESKFSLRTMIARHESLYISVASGQRVNASDSMAEEMLSYGHTQE